MLVTTFEEPRVADGKKEDALPLYRHRNRFSRPMSKGRELLWHYTTQGLAE